MSRNLTLAVELSEQISRARVTLTGLMGANTGGLLSTSYVEGLLHEVCIFLATNSSVLLWPYIVSHCLVLLLPIPSPDSFPGNPPDNSLPHLYNNIVSPRVSSVSLELRLGYQCC